MMIWVTGREKRIDSPWVTADHVPEVDPELDEDRLVEPLASLNRSHASAVALSPRMAVHGSPGTNRTSGIPGRGPRSGPVCRPGCDAGCIRSFPRGA